MANTISACPDKRATGPERKPASFIDARRRGFLQGAAIAGGAAVAAPALADREVVESPDVAGVATASTGYRETDHVREYYARARF